jgi:hypothetical protein
MRVLVPHGHGALLMQDLYVEYVFRLCAVLEKLYDS